MAESAELLGLTREDWTVPALMKTLSLVLDYVDMNADRPLPPLDRLCAAVAKARLLVATYYNA